MFQKIRCAARENVKRSAVLLLEAAILLVMLYQAIAIPVKKLNITCADFLAAGIGNAVYNGSSIALEGSGLSNISVWGQHLKSGAYEVEVRYRAETEGSEGQTLTVGSLAIETKEPILYHRVELKNTGSSAKGTVWVPLGIDCRDVCIMVGHRGVGKLMVEGVTVTENYGYRYVQIAGVALLFLICNLIYAYFFSAGFELTPRRKTFLALSGIVFVACIPYFADALFYGHDMFFHLPRIVQIAAELENGQIPVRMYTAANNGYGYPSAIYYGDILLYIPAILYNCLVPLHTCYQIYVVMINALTCAIAYYCFFRITKQRAIGVLGAAMYVLCAFRLVNLNVRAAVGEYSAMTFLPLVFLGINEIYSKNKPKYTDWLPLSLGMAGILLCHLLTTELVVVTLVIFCLLMLRKTFSLARLAAILKAAVVCILLCAWFIVPFLDYYLTQDILIKELYDPLQERGVYLIQLLGVFMPGEGSCNLGEGIQDTMPITIGISLTLGIAMILFCLLKRRQWEVQDKKAYPIWSMFFMIGLLEMLFTLQCFPWRIIQTKLGTQPGQLGQMIGSIQYPWRWLTTASVLLVFSLMYVMVIVRKNDEKLFRAFCIALALALAISTGFLYYEHSDQTSFLRSYRAEKNEFLDTLYYLNGTDGEKLAESSARVTKGSAQIQDYRKEAGTAYLTIGENGNEPAEATIPVFAYRHYRALDEAGNVVPLSVGENNCIALEIEPGFSGEIQVQFVPPMYWRAAEIVSLAMALALVFAGVSRFVKRKKYAD